MHGAELAFCVPGESYLPVLDALYTVRERIQLITCRHESGAANMAEAYGKLTGTPGICLVTRGPGATNASIGVHTAFQDSTPMILLIGQVGTDFMEREAFQEIDYRRMFGPMSKWVAQIDRTDRIPEFIARAYQVATSGRMGPVVLALPEDVLSGTAAVADARHVAANRVGAVAGGARPSCREMLGEAQRPVPVGRRQRLERSRLRAPAALRRDATDRRSAVSFASQDLFDNAHPNYAGDVGIGINPKLAERIKAFGPADRPRRAAGRDHHQRLRPDRRAGADATRAGAHLSGRGGAGPLLSCRSDDQRHDAGDDACAGGAAASVTRDGAKAQVAAPRTRTIKPGRRARRFPARCRCGM